MTTNAAIRGFESQINLLKNQIVDSIYTNKSDFEELWNSRDALNAKMKASLPGQKNAIQDVASQIAKEEARLSEMKSQTKALEIQWNGIHSQDASCQAALAALNVSIQNSNTLNEKAAKIDAEVAAKRVAYENSSVFMMLLKNGFATENYKKSWFLNFDRWFAKTIDFANQKVAYEVLLGMPSCLAENVANAKLKQNTLKDEYDQKVEDATGEVGINYHEMLADCQEQANTIKTLYSTKKSLEEKLHSTESEIASIAQGNDRYAQEIYNKIKSKVYYLDTGSLTSYHPLGHQISMLVSQLHAEVRAEEAREAERERQRQIEAAARRRREEEERAERASRSAAAARSSSSNSGFGGGGRSGGGFGGGGGKVSGGFGG